MAGRSHGAPAPHCGGGVEAAGSPGRHAVAATPGRRDRQGSGGHVARARRAGAARRCSRSISCGWSRLFLGRAGLAARSYQCGASLRHDRRGRTFLGRDRLAERRLCDRLRSRHDSAALAERRLSLWGIHRVRTRHGRQRLLCGDHQICAAASPRNVPGLLCRHRSYSRTGELCHGVGPEQAEARTRGRVHPVGRELPAAARAHQPDDLRHRRLLQYRDGDRDRMLHRPAGVQLDPAVVAGTADAPPARRRLARSPPPRNRLQAVAVGGLGEPHVWPGRGGSGSGGAVAARPTDDGALGRPRGHPTSRDSRVSRIARDAGCRVRGPRAGKRRDGKNVAQATRRQTRCRFRRRDGHGRRSSGAQSHSGHLRSTFRACCLLR